MFERNSRGQFLRAWWNDSLDPRSWPEDLPYQSLQLSERDDSLHCLIDAVDWPWIKLNRWFMTNGKGQVWGNARKSYAARSANGPKHEKPRKHQLIWLHKEILDRMYPPPTEDHYIGDHLNGDSLDNRRSNLRWATFLENQQNKFGRAYYQRAMELA